MSDDVIPLNEIGEIGTVKVYNQAYVDKQQKRIAELEKENAENESEARELNIRLDRLIKENAELRKEWQEQVQKATDEGYVRTLQTIQLTNAKKIIKDLLNLPFASNEEVFADVGSYLYKAEQFLKDLEK